MKNLFNPILLGLCLAILLIKCEIDSRNAPLERLKEESRLSEINFQRFSDSLRQVKRQFFIQQQEPNLIDSLNRKQGIWAIYLDKDSTITTEIFKIKKKLVLEFFDNEPLGSISCFDYYKKQLKWKANIIKRDSLYVFDGILENYNAENQITQTITYKDGKINGVKTTYYPNGNRKSAELLYNDILEGKSKYFYENGNIKEEVIYKEGILSGSKIKYFDTGEVSAKQQFDLGKLNGPYIEFYKNGSYKSIGEYSNGSRCCNWKFFDESGNFSETKFLDVRVGAICNDGTRSSATGRGACSHHGGVNYWLTEVREIQIKENKAIQQSPLSKYTY